MPANAQHRQPHAPASYSRTLLRRGTRGGQRPHAAEEHRPAVTPREAEALLFGEEKPIPLSRISRIS